MLIKQHFLAAACLAALSPTIAEEAQAEAVDPSRDGPSAVGRALIDGCLRVLSSDVSLADLAAEGVLVDGGAGAGGKPGPASYHLTDAPFVQFNDRMGGCGISVDGNDSQALRAGALDAFGAAELEFNIASSGRSPNGSSHRDVLCAAGEGGSWFIALVTARLPGDPVPLLTLQIGMMELPPDDPTCRNARLEPLDGIARELD